jgi:hypothetical protein
MAEIRRGLGGDASGGERLPWLEPVEDETEEPRGGYGGLALLGIALLVVIGLLIAGIVMVRSWRAGHSDMGQIIHAPAGPYKEKPSDPGGLKVDQAGIVAERTGTGGDINSPLDLAAIPEQPVTGPGSVPAVQAAIPVAVPGSTGKPAAPVAAPAPLAAPPVAAKAPPPTVPAGPPVIAAGDGGTIQLGAFSSQAKAKAAWKSLSTRFSFLSPMTMAVIPVKSGEATLYRLRASGGESAASVCAKLKVAGEICVVTG